MRYLSVCSGIEAATVAWHPLGWRATAFAEIDVFASAVLAHHYPDIPNHGDFTTIQGDEYETTDLIVGGTPCQSFSVAGKRGGLDDPRGNLAIEFCKLADRIKPRWVVWENVPGILSADEGRAFGSFVETLREVGYGCAWRVLDAQYIRTQSHPRAVPQRRRRVFLVGYLGDWRPSVAVLFERQSMQGHPPPSRKAGSEVANTVATHLGTGGFNNPDFVMPVSPAVTAKWAKGTGCPAGDECQNLVTFDTRQDPQCYENHDGPLTSTHPVQAIAFTPGAARRYGRPGFENVSGNITTATGDNRMAVATFLNRGDGATVLDDGASHAVKGGEGGTSKINVMDSNVVRRITPLECERLMGFPDSYTAVDYNGRPMSDSARYRMLGNSMAVNVMRWIGERIQMFESLKIAR